MKNNEAESMRDLLESGIKSEKEAQRVYGQLSKKDIPQFLEKKLTRLEKEELGHEKILRNLFSTYFPNKDPNLPEESDKPAPKIDFNEESVQELLKQAMKSEKESEGYYQGLAEEFKKEDEKEDRFSDDPAKIAKYLAYMERGHYEIIKTELEGLRELGENYEEIDDLST